MAIPTALAMMVAGRYMMAIQEALATTVAQELLTVTPTAMVCQ